MFPVKEFLGNLIMARYNPHIYGSKLNCSFSIRRKFGLHNCEDHILVPATLLLPCALPTTNLSSKSALEKKDLVSQFLQDPQRHSLLKEHSTRLLPVGLSLSEGWKVTIWPWKTSLKTSTARYLIKIRFLRFPKIHPSDKLATISNVIDGQLLAFTSFHPRIRNP